jgi:histone-binding protein RBBP4
MFWVPNPGLIIDSRKKNTPYLYDTVITHALDWPTLTCQWFPEVERFVLEPTLMLAPSKFVYISPPGKPYTSHRLLFGTHTSGQGRDYLQIATLQLPKNDPQSADRDVLSRDQYDDEKGGMSVPCWVSFSSFVLIRGLDRILEIGSHNTSHHARLQIIQKINHEGEVNRARYMPQNPDLIASKAIKGSVFIFDRTKHPSEPERDGVCRPDIELVGQEKEGWVSFYTKSSL